jgi:hypothetical protein
MNGIEAAARALYECEKERANHCERILTRAAGKPIVDHMEPWEECRDCYLGDARAALEASITQMGWPEIHAFRSEIAKGQSIYEDAGGFIMRGIRRLFGLPQATDREVVTYQQAARAMIDKQAQSGRMSEQ